MKHSTATIHSLPTCTDAIEGPVQFLRFQTLRDGAEAEFEALLRQHQDHPALLRVQDASRSLARALQAACLELRQGAGDGAALRQGLESQLAYLQACLKRSFSDY